MNTTPEHVFSWIALLGVSLLVLSACGGSRTTSPLVGTYALDVDKTLQAAADAGASLGVGALLLHGDAGAREALVDGMSPETYRFELRSDQTFSLAIGGGEQPFRVEGVWAVADTGLETETRTVGGTPAAQEGLPGVDRIEFEGDWLVLANEGQRIYLRKL